MIWFNIKNLEDKISSNKLSEKDGYNYLLASSIYGIIYMLYVSIVGFNYLSFLGAGAGIFMAVIFLPILFKINSSIDNKDFIKRYIAIGWVVRMKIMLYNVIFMLLFLNIFDLTTPSLAKDMTLFLFSIGISALSYVLITNSFKRVRLVKEMYRNHFTEA